MFVIDLLLLALHPVVFPNPGMERVCRHFQVARRLRISCSDSTASVPMRSLHAPGYVLLMG